MLDTKTRLNILTANLGKLATSGSDDCKVRYSALSGLEIKGKDIEVLYVTISKDQLQEVIDGNTINTKLTYTVRV